jgi:hypothetical protein
VSETIIETIKKKKTSMKLMKMGIEGSHPFKQVTDDLCPNEKPNLITSI